MDLLMRIDIDVVAFFVLAVVGFIAIRQLDASDLLSRIFIYMIIITSIELATEIVSCVVDGKPGIVAIILNYAINMAIFSLGPVIMMLWCLFIEFWIYHDTKRVHKKAFLLSIPLSINLLLSLSSPFTGVVFSIDALNGYHRGMAFFLPVILAYALIVYSMVFTVINRAKLDKEEFPILLLFTVPSILGGTIQTLLYGLLLTWSIIAFTLGIMYIYLQQKMTQVDSLTGAWTRGTLDRYLDRRISRSNKSGGFGVIMIDLDNFKSINDKFGHSEGDRALRNVVRILKTALRKEDIVARYGGDEFVILLEMSMEYNVERILRRIEKCFDNWNESHGMKYKLEYSSGYSVYLPESALTMDEFLFRVDSLMYAAKYERKKKSMQFV